MSAPARQDAARLAEALFSLREVGAVRPVGRSGLRLLFRGTDRGLVLDTLPAPLAIVPVRGATPRPKGGRGAWPDAVAAADRALAGHRLERVLVETRGRAVRLEFSGGHRVVAGPSRRGAGAIAVELAGDAARLVPEGAEPPLAAAGPDGWRDASEGPGDVDGRDAAGLEERWRQARAESLVASRRDAMARTLGREARRAERALRAVARDEERGGDPVEIRRRAEALLAAGPAASVRGRSLVVPDPYEPSREIEVEVDPPGATAAQLAERLFGKARRAERGRRARAVRARELEARRAALDGLARRVTDAADDAALDAVEREAITAGIALAAASSRPAGPRRERRPVERPARAWRSPSGFDVLAGRSARQNDRLTFRVASPDDLWFHVRERPGAHVVLRTGGRADIPEADVLFAARVAAAFCRAPDGETVEVHVARRKHVRKPRGAPPGQVLVRRSRTVSVRVGPPPALK